MYKIENAPPDGGVFCRINPSYYIYRRYNITHLTGKKVFGSHSQHKKNHAKESLSHKISTASCHGFANASFAFTPLLCICCNACQHTNQQHKALQHLPQLHRVTATCRGPAALLFSSPSTSQLTHKGFASFCVRLNKKEPGVSATNRLPSSAFFCSAAVPMAGGGGRSAFFSSLRSAKHKTNATLHPVHPAKTASTTNFIIIVLLNIFFRY